MKDCDYVEPVLQSISKAERHLKSEYGNKMVGVMHTIAEHPHFAMMLAPGVVRVCSGRDEVDAMYKASVDFAEPRASRLLSQLATDWYLFVENVPTRLWIAEGVERTAQTVNIFMSDAESGLTGEYAWQRYYAPKQVLADGSAGFPVDALRNLELHAELLEALCTGNATRLEQVLDPACLWAHRNYLTDVTGGEIMNLQGAEAVTRHLADWHAALRPEHVSIINRKVADWFVFSEELWVVRPRGSEVLQYRTAVIYPVNAAGKFEGALGFGKNLEPISPSATMKLGLSLWPPGVSAVPQE